MAMSNCKGDKYKLTMSGCQYIPVEGACYKSIAESATKSLRHLISIISDYPKAPSETHPLCLAYREVSSLIRDDQYVKASLILEGLQLELNSFAKFNPGDVFARTVIQSIVKIHRAFQLQIMDYIKRTQTEQIGRAHV